MSPTSKVPLDSRLRAILRLSRRGKIPADIGSDHSYIPIHLLQQDDCKIAVAADLNQGPLDNAARNAIKFGVEDRLFLFLSDGLDRVPCEELGVGDVYLCGMGGELIQRIISRSSYVRSKDVRLILQPMTEQTELRSFLASEGFDIVDEAISRDGRRLYQCIAVEYTGKRYSLSKTELLLGPKIIARGNKEPLFIDYLAFQNRVLAKIVKGRKQGGLDVTSQEEMISSIKRLMEEQQ